MMDHILTVIIFLPLFMAVIFGLFQVETKVLKIGAFVSSSITLILVVWLTYVFDPAAEGMQFVVNAPWIQNAGISYYIGVDFLSLTVLLLITLLMPPSVSVYET